MKHKKPTQEELVKVEQEAIAEAEKLQDAPEVEEEPTEVPQDEPEAEIEASQEEVVPEKEQAEPSEEEKQRLKDKLSASARENQKIYAKNRVINQAIVEAEDLPEPTEEELAKEYKDWDVASDTERILLKETYVTKQWRAKIAEAGKQATKIEKWNDSVEAYADDPQTLIDNPELEGKTEQFKKFAMEEANNSVPMKILVSAFLHENSSGKIPNKGKMFEKGSGGANVKPVPTTGKISMEEARKLRETDYDKWKEKLNAGLIESDF
jgi:hypothetical protein